MFVTKYTTTTTTAIKMGVTAILPERMDFTYSGWSQFLLIQKAIMFFLIESLLPNWVFSPSEIIYKRFTRYGNCINWCLYPD